MLDCRPTEKLEVIDRHMNQVKKLSVDAVFAIVGLTFLFAGIAKLNDFTSVFNSLRWVPGGTVVRHSFLSTLIATDLVVGFLFSFSIYRELSARIGIALLATFTLFLMLQIGIPEKFGADCGCFGASSRGGAVWGIVRNVLLISGLAFSLKEIRNEFRDS